MLITGATTCAIALCLATGAGAQDWQALAGPEITRALERHVLRYSDGSEQVFSYGGLTAYRIGWPNEGRWAIRGDRYCSLWPPRLDWVCHDVSRKGATRLRFTDDLGHQVEARILEEEE